MSIVAEIDQDEAVYIVEPAFGRRVVFDVRVREVNVARQTGYWSPPRRIAPRYVVGLRGSDGSGFSTHTSFDAACRSALYRARRYEKAFSVARPTARRESVAA